MARIRGKDTKPEMIVRRTAHAMGYRFRLHRRDLPGAPDLVFPGRRKAIQVHGCFWHWHPDLTCPIAKMPKSRTAFWTEKLQRNRDRDRRKEQELRGQGYGLLVLWECEVNRLKGPALEQRLRAFLEGE